MKKNCASGWLFTKIIVIWVNELCETYRLKPKLVNIKIKRTNKLCQKRWKQPSPFELIKNTAGA